MIAGFLTSLLCGQALAQSHGYKPFPGDPIDPRTRNMQERVEELYLAGNYGRAFFVYENELAPIGDKYAQYMVGFMRLNGEGTQRDEVEALAWYRLAAERGEEALAHTRDELAAELSPRQIERSDARFRELWRRYGDRALILELLRRDMEILRSRTGTRIASASNASPVVVLHRSGEQAGPVYFLDLRKRLADRLAYLNAKVEISDLAIADDLAGMQSDESEIRRELAALGDH